MEDLRVYLENGFDHDRVVVTAGGREQVEPAATTRYQVGLAATVALPLPGPTAVRVALPERGLTAEVEVDPAETPHLRVDVVDGALDLRPQAAPPMFA